MTNSSRRDFLHNSATAGLAAGIGDFAFLHQLPCVSAQEAALPRQRVQLSSDIEPLVRMIEDTERNKLLEAVAQRIRQGTTYQSLLAAVMLAGVRGIQPRPVGFKFHAVLVINSAHLASLSASDRDRWLPLFWAIDNYKTSQARNRTEGNWSMSEISGTLPDSAHAATRFREAMENWDTEPAYCAIAAWTRVAGQNEIYEAFWGFGARDFRDIGHKAIFVANSYRTLQAIGWRHAEPILRSLAYALLEHEGTNPAKRDDEKDRLGRDNLERLKKIRPDWQQGRIDRDASRDLLQTVRTGSSVEASSKVAEMLNAGISPASVWDGLYLTAGELLMRQPGIVVLHTITSLNALRFGFDTSASDETRRFLLLQGAAFLPQFRQAMQGRGKVRDDLNIDTLEAADLTNKDDGASEEIFGEVSKDRVQAARKTLKLLNDQPDQVQPLMAAARRLIFSRGTDSHDYKFSAAALEDYYNLTPAWRNRFLAASMFQLKGTGAAETDLTQRIRAALAK